jgi:hypothetical protein
MDNLSSEAVRSLLISLFPLAMIQDLSRTLGFDPDHFADDRATERTDHGSTGP